MRSSLKQKGSYGLAFGIIAVMLYVAGFPVFLLVFFSVIAFFIWKALSAASDDETKRIFDLYLSAGEILRDDGRKWYGFEIREAIAKGEDIVAELPAAPPLVHFVLGALHQRIGDHSRAVEYLENVIGEGSPGEISIVSPSGELRDYVMTLRKIERSRAEAPVTSAAVRFLERMRKNKGPEMLDASRRQLECSPVLLADQGPGSTGDPAIQETKTKRSTISEVLHDVYDDNIQ